MLIVTFRGSTLVHAVWVYKIQLMYKGHKKELAQTYRTRLDLTKHLRDSVGYQNNGTLTTFSSETPKLFEIHEYFSFKISK